MADIPESTETIPDHLAGAVSEDAIRHLMIRSPLNQAIYKAIREHSLSNMAFDDDHTIPYPLVDLMSNPAPADIGSGEMQMVYLTDEIESAVLATRAAPPAMDREAVELVAGPIWAEQEDDCFTAEIQAVGGDYVVATVHGATRDEAERRQLAILSTLSADAIRQGLSPPPPLTPAMGGKA